MCKSSSYHERYDTPQPLHGQNNTAFGSDADKEAVLVNRIPRIENSESWRQHRQALVQNYALCSLTVEMRHGVFVSIGLRREAWIVLTRGVNPCGCTKRGGLSFQTGPVKHPNEFQRSCVENTRSRE